MIFSQCEINKLFWRQFVYCMQLKETWSKSKENVLNRKFNAFDVEYEIYFTRETAFFIFSLVLSTQENIKMPCHVWNKFRLSTSNHWIFCIYQNEWFYRIWRQTCGSQFHVDWLCFLMTQEKRIDVM